MNVLAAISMQSICLQSLCGSNLQRVSRRNSNFETKVLGEAEHPRLIGGKNEHCLADTLRGDRAQKCL